MKILAVFLVLASGAFAQSAQGRTVQDRPMLISPLAKMVDAARWINTEEVRYRNANQHYGTYDELKAFADLQGDTLPPALEKPAFSVSIGIERNGEHYNATFKGRRCTENVFTDDSGQIYMGHALGCKDMGITPIGE